MSFFHGLGMFIFGMGATIFGAIVAYFIINKVIEKKEEPKRFDDLEWKREYTLTNIKLDLIKKII